MNSNNNYYGSECYFIYENLLTFDAVHWILTTNYKINGVTIGHVILWRKVQVKVIL